MMTTAQAILEAARIIRDAMLDAARLHAEWAAQYQHQRDTSSQEHSGDTAVTIALGTEEV